MALNRIIRIKAHSNFIEKQKPELLSFRKGQEFYALHYDNDKQLYFVSTHYSIPFGRNSVCGFSLFH